MMAEPPAFESDFLNSTKTLLLSQIKKSGEKMLVLWILLSIIGFVALWLGFWSLVTFAVSRSTYQQEFLLGKTPTAPDGFYQGSAHVLFDQKTPWLGKSFDSVNSLGFNILTPQGGSILKTLTPLYKRFNINQNGETEAYYFKTRTEPGLKDKSLNVIKLDYNSKENPFPIRIILDEIVQIAPEQYLGKIHVKVFPYFYATIGYFGLKK
jgi:hypothetical protein